MPQRYSSSKPQGRPTKQEVQVQKHKCFCQTCENMITPIVPGVQSPWFCKECEARVQAIIRKEDLARAQQRTRPWYTNRRWKS